MPSPQTGAAVRQTAEAGYAIVQQIERGPHRMLCFVLLPEGRTVWVSVDVDQDTQVLRDVIARELRDGRRYVAGEQVAPPYRQPQAPAP